MVLYLRRQHDSFNRSCRVVIELQGGQYESNDEISEADLHI
nr:MAG TPA: hypothetical protein [Caudoviricetes sp.]